MSKFTCPRLRLLPNKESTCIPYHIRYYRHTNDQSSSIARHRSTHSSVRFPREDAPVVRPTTARQVKRSIRAPSAVASLPTAVRANWPSVSPPNSRFGPGKMESRKNLKLKSRRSSEATTPIPPDLPPRVQTARTRTTRQRLDTSTTPARTTLSPPQPTCFWALSPSERCPLPLGTQTNQQVIGTPARCRLSRCVGSWSPRERSSALRHGPVRY